VVIKHSGSILEQVSVDPHILMQLNSHVKSTRESYIPPDLEKLVSSEMFEDQHSKLRWIKKRLQTYVVCVVLHTGTVRFICQSSALFKPVWWQRKCHSINKHHDVDYINIKTINKCVI